MPRPARRAQHPSAEGGVHQTTPTRPSTSANAITAVIPPSMLETPTGPRFQVTPVAAAADVHAFAIEGARQLRRQRGVEFQPSRAPDSTPLNANGRADNDPDTSQISVHPTEDETTNDESSLLESVHHSPEDARALVGLRDISSLATWTLSSAKPGCALAQLRHPSPTYFWQSDGPQPHTLSLHFFKLVSIVKIRIYLDFKLDESYTPTKIKFWAGMSEGGLVEFASWEVEESVDPDTGEPTSNVDKIRGWIEIPLKGVGGRDPQYYEAQEARRARAYERLMQQIPDFGTTAMEVDDDFDDGDDLEGGDVLRAMIVQVRIMENHQNGKDTHVRGFQVFAKDETSGKEMRKLVKRVKPKSRSKKGAVTKDDVDVSEEMVGLQPAEWMAEPDIR